MIYRDKYLAVRCRGGQMAAETAKELAGREIDKAAREIAEKVVEKRRESIMTGPLRPGRGLSPAEETRWDLDSLMEDLGKKYRRGTEETEETEEETKEETEAAAETPAAPAPRGKYDPIPEAERTNPNRKENEFMMNLMIVRNALESYAPSCRDRALKAGRWTWRNIRLAQTLIRKIQEDLAGTMPARRDEYYRTYSRNGHYELVMNGPKRPGRFVLISDRHLAAIVDAAMENACIMCMLHDEEISKCPLRAALLEVAPPTELQDGRWKKCEYREAAGNLLRDEEISI